MRRLLALIVAFALCGLPAYADVSVGNGSIGVPVGATQGGTGQSSFTTNCVVAATSSTALGCTTTPTLTGTNFTGVPFAGVTGTVPVNQGGTNLTSYTTGQILYASGSGTLAGLSDVATGQVLASGGVGAAPAFSATPAFSGANITAASIPNAALVSTPDITTCTTWTPNDSSGASLSLTVTTASYCRTTHGDGTHSTVAQGDVTYPVTANGSPAQLGGLPVAAITGHFACALGFSSTATGVSLAISTGSAVILFYATPSAAGALPNSTLSTGHFRFVCPYQSV